MKCSLQWNSPLMEEAWSSVRLSVARLISWIKIAKSEETITPILTPCKIKKLSLLLLNHWFKTYIGVTSYREVWVGVCLARSNIGQRFGKQEFHKECTKSGWSWFNEHVLHKMKIASRMTLRRERASLLVSPTYEFSMETGTVLWNKRRKPRLIVILPYKL